MRSRVATALVLLAAVGGAITACGSQENAVQTSNASAQLKHGSVLFTERCSGCHTLATVGTQGSATRVHDRERVDGPSFDVRKECLDNVLYAVRNGGYSGAIMPQNIVVGHDADDIAAFLQQYSGLKRTATAGSKPTTCPTQ